MIAEELHKLIKKDIESHIETLVTNALDKTLSVEEAALKLGIKPKTLYNKIKQIPHTKVGRRLIFSENRLNEYMLQRK